MTRCARCGRTVEPERECYAVPTCYACLPPPDPLPVCELGRQGRRNRTLVSGAGWVLVALATLAALAVSALGWWADGALWHSLFGGHR